MEYKYTFEVREVTVKKVKKQISVILPHFFKKIDIYEHGSRETYGKITNEHTLIINKILEMEYGEYCTSFELHKDNISLPYRNNNKCIDLFKDEFQSSEQEFETIKQQAIDFLT